MSLSIYERPWKKRRPSPALTRKSRWNITFPLLQTPCPSRACRRNPGKVAGAGKGENSYPTSSPIPDSVMLGAERKVKFHLSPSFPNLDWQYPPPPEKNTVCKNITLELWRVHLPSGTHGLFPLCLTALRDSPCLLMCPTLCPERLAWPPSGWDPQTWLYRSVRCTPLAGGVLPTVASSLGNCLF